MAQKRKLSPKKKAIKKKRTRNAPPVRESFRAFLRKNLIPLAVLFVLPILLYWFTLQFDYVLDDKIVITENNFTTKGLHGILEILTTDSFEGYFGEQRDILPGGRYRPLSLVTFAIEHHFFGLNPRVGHLINVLLYCLTGLFLYRILQIFFPLKADKKWYLSIPFAASLLFILHPIHSEVVANIKGRDEILAFLFSLGALYFTLRFIRTNKINWLAASGVSLLLGILSKENAITWMAIIPLSLYFFIHTPREKYRSLGIAFLLVFISYIGIRYQALGFLIYGGEGSTEIMNNPFYGLQPGQKVGMIIYTLGMYIKLLIFPHPLTHDYYPYQIPILDLIHWKVLLALLVNIGAVIFASWGLKKKHIVSYAILLYLIPLTIVSNIFINVGTTMNERFIYFSSLGFCLLLAYLLCNWLPSLLSNRHKSGSLISVSLIALLSVGYVAKTIARIPDWKDPQSLSNAAVKYSPNSARANCFMGVALFEDYKIETDRARKDSLLVESTIYTEKALEIVPSYGSALIMWSGILAENYKRDGDIDKLLDGFTHILSYISTPEFTLQYIDYLITQQRSPAKVLQFLYNVGYNINSQQRKSNTTAIFYLNKALQIDPSNKQVIQALAQCYQIIGNPTKADEYKRMLQ